MYFDAGAYKGTVFTEVAEADWGDGVEAHLIEPNPDSFRILQQAADSAKQSKRAKQAHCHNLAVGSVKGSLCFRAEDTRTRVLNESEHFDPSNKEEYFEVKASTLDEIAAAWGVKHISILKVDVEGHEGEVLKGAQNLLKTQAVDILYIEAGIDPDNKQQFFYRALEDTLRPLRYRLFKIYEQTHEWLTDSPFLRRVNLAFMSETFATQTPYRLSKKLFDLRKKNSQIESALAAASESASKAATEHLSKYAKLETGLFASEQECAALQERICQVEESAKRQAAELEAKLTEREKVLEEKNSEIARYQQEIGAAEETGRRQVAELEVKLTERERALAEKEAEAARYRHEIEAAEETFRRQIADNEVKLTEREKAFAEKEAEATRYREEIKAAEETGRKKLAEFEAKLAELRDRVSEAQNERSILEGAQETERAFLQQEIKSAEKRAEKLSAELRISKEKSEQLDQEKRLAIREKKLEAERHTAELKEYRKRTAGLQNKMENEGTVLRAKAASSESSAQAARETISFKLGGAILDALKSPAKAIALPSTLLQLHKAAGSRLSHEELRKEISGRGPRFVAMLKLLQEADLPTLREHFVAIKLSQAAQVEVLTALAKEALAATPLRAIDAAQEAQKLDPKPFRAKWLAFRLAEQGQIAEAVALLDGLASGCSFSASEQRRIQSIKLQKVDGKRASRKALQDDIAMKGPKFLRMLEILEKSDLAALRRHFSSIKLSSAAQADALVALSEELLTAAPGRAIEAAREAEKLDPKSSRSKWLAFLLSEQDRAVETTAQLKDAPKGGKVSPAEKKQPLAIISASPEQARSESKQSDIHEKKGPKKAQAGQPKIEANSALREKAELFIEHVKNHAFADLLEERCNFLVRYFRDEEYFLSNFALLLMCDKLRAHSEGTAFADRIFKRFEGRLGDLEVIFGKASYQNLIICTASCLTRVGRYNEARALVDKALAESGGRSAYAALRATICWPYDLPQAISDLKTVVAEKKKKNSTDHLLLAQLISNGPDYHPTAGGTGEFLLVDANASLAKGDFAGYTNRVNDYFAEQGLGPVFSPESRSFDFTTLLSGLAQSSEGPLVSVIMTTFNSVDTMDYAIASVLQQTHQNLELFIVDDLSSDGTREKLESLAARDNRVRLIFNETNVGTYAAKNRAMELAQGEFVTFHDSDDWAHPQRIARHLEVMIENPELDVTRSSWLRILPSGEVLFRRWGNSFSHANPASTFLRREVIERVGYFDSIRFGADSEYWFRFHRVVGRKRVRTIKPCLAIGRFREDSLTRGGAGAMNDENFSSPRSRYNYLRALWHANTEPTQLRVPAHPSERLFPAPEEAIGANLPGNGVLSGRFHPRFVETSAENAVPNFIFGISLASAQACFDWRRTQQLLGHTLQSLIHQTDGRFRVVICGHEKPDLQEMDDERVLFFESDMKPPENSTKFRRDKMHKRRLMASVVREMGGGYVFPLDADDLIHKNFVAFCLNDNNRTGYLIDQGYVLDYNNRRLAPVPGAWDASYDRVCGSSATIYFHPDELPHKGDDKDERLYFNLFQSHAYWPIVAQEFGRPLKKVPFAASVYSVNHSQNLSFNLQRAGLRVQNIINSIERMAIADGDLVLQRDFHWSGPSGSSLVSGESLHHNSTVQVSQT